MLLAAQSLFPSIKQFIDLGLKRQWMNVGEAVFKEGDAVDDGLYVLITGRIKLKSRGSSLVTELGRGDILGEDSFLMNAKAGEGMEFRCATAVCMRDCELVKISTQNFELICAQHPKVALKLTKSIARRSLNRASTAHSSTQLMSQARANERIAGHSQTANLATLAVMPVNSESQTGTDALVSLLGDELRKFGAVLILDDVAIAEVLGEETLTTMHLPFYKTRVASWIVQQEEDYRFVILKGSLGNAAWSSICVSQVLLMCC